MSTTLNEQLAHYFVAHPLTWIDGVKLEQIAGRYAWRSRVSDLRKPPFDMTIENRQRRITPPKDRPLLKPYTVSEYRFVPRPEAHPE